jgi:hypothetical protein
MSFEASGLRYEYQERCAQRGIRGLVITTCPSTPLLEVVATTRVDGDTDAGSMHPLRERDHVLLWLYINPPGDLVVPGDERDSLTAVDKKEGKDWEASHPTVRTLHTLLDRARWLRANISGDTTSLCGERGRLWIQEDVKIPDDGADRELECCVVNVSV